jgi:phage terminase large subunit
MIFKPLDIYEPVFTTKARYIDLWGGRGRGGSHFASDYFIFKITCKDYFRGFVSRAVYSDIETSIWQELIDRIEENEDGQKDLKNLLLTEQPI